MRLIPLRRSPRAKVSQARLFVGQLPAGLPFELPVPPSCRIIGTIIQGTLTTVLLNSDLSPNQVLAFYQEQLVTSDWAVIHYFPSSGGLVDLVHSQAKFCKPPQGLSLLLMSHAYAEQPTEIRLEIDMTPGLSCDPRSIPPPDPAELEPPMPLPYLTPPIGDILEQGGGHYGSRAAFTKARLITSLDLRSVVDHYAKQLREAGYSERDHGREAVLAWSTWDRDNAERKGREALFLAWRQPNERNLYFLFLRVASGDMDERLSGPQRVWSGIPVAGS